MYPFDPHITNPDLNAFFINAKVQPGSVIICHNRPKTIELLRKGVVFDLLETEAHADFDLFSFDSASENHFQRIYDNDFVGSVQRLIRSGLGEDFYNFEFICFCLAIFKTLLKTL